MVALGQRLRRVADRITATPGAEPGKRVRHWLQDKKAAWCVVLAEPQMQASSTLLAPAHNAIDYRLFAMQGLHHPGGINKAQGLGRR